LKIFIGSEKKSEKEVKKINYKKESDMNKFNKKIKKQFDLKNNYMYNILKGYKFGSFYIFKIVI
tara:strand:- start:1161 stop:1352 length:192 start_codon:yes stop_codon:yes gene_type:complete